MALYQDEGSDEEMKTRMPLDSGAISSPRPTTGNEAKRKKAAEAARKRKERTRTQGHLIQQTEKPGTATPRTITVKRHSEESDEDEVEEKPSEEPVAPVDDHAADHDLDAVVVENTTTKRHTKKHTAKPAAEEEAEKKPAAAEPETPKEERVAPSALNVPLAVETPVTEEATPKKIRVKKHKKPSEAAAAEKEQPAEEEPAAVRKTAEREPIEVTAVPISVATPNTPAEERVKHPKKPATPEKAQEEAEPEPEPEKPVSQPKEKEKAKEEEEEHPEEEEKAKPAAAAAAVVNPPAPISGQNVITTPGGMQVIAASALNLNSAEAIREFMTKPGPKGAYIQCKIQRMEKLYPQYYIYLEETNQFLLAARKRKRSSTSNYLISSDQADLSRGGAHFVGKVRSNFVGTELVIYDGGLSPKKKEATPETLRKELACVMYGTNVLGLQGPRKMVILLPTVGDDGKIQAPQPNGPGESLAEKFKAGKTNEIIPMQNKSPVWNEETQSYVLNFHKRVKLPSVKNFQIVRQDNIDEVLMQFGRVTQYTFALDYQYPFSLMQAFGIALTSFDNKLACE